jgi:hypothetical protein
MSTTEQFPCDVCHERLATHHICFGGTGKSSHLCDECFESSAPIDIRQLTAEMRAAHCQYCGGQPCGGGTDSLALAMGVQQTKFMCLSCSQEYYRYMQQEIPTDRDGLSQQEQLAALQKFRDQADAHMRQWVSERGSR